eukprot:scaffold53286_cov34-Phaeocystis_antarctica.AAC.1
MPRADHISSPKVALTITISSPFWSLPCFSRLAACVPGMMVSMYTALPKLSRNLSPSCSPCVAAFSLRKATTLEPAGALLRLRSSRLFLLSSTHAPRHDP